MFQLHNISKLYGKKVALQNVTFTAGSGEIIGLIGPNGSGKTTLLNILMGMIRPSGGHFKLGSGLRIGMSVSRKGLFDDMTTWNNIRYYAGVSDSDLSATQSILQTLRIDYSDVLFSNLSAGMKQKVSIALAFTHVSDLILLDEPSNHLDIDTLISLRQLIMQKSEGGTSFLITSHILSDLEKVCSRFIFLREGNTIGDFHAVQLLEQFGSLEAAYLHIVRGLSE